jgi:16S rRNA (guanine1207-N2)-methyltransferase
LSEHYYSNKPSSASDRRTVEANLRGFRLKLTTDAGVFSKGGVDFGTKVLIECMQVGPHDEVLDVGCGYGPIGLVAAKLAEKGHVVMVDINERAVELARQNAEANGIRNVTILQGDKLEAVRGQLFDVILTNPPIRAGKAVVHQIFADSLDHLKDGGSLWVVIQNKQGAPSARKKLEELFGPKSVEEVEKSGGYRIYRARKISDQKSLT